MRNDAPVHRIPFGPDGAGTAWLITRYEDARKALTDPRLAKEPVLRTRIGGASPVPPAVAAAMGKHMLNADPPEHTRLRRLVSTTFTARRMEALRPGIQAISDSLLEAMSGKDEADLIDDYAFPLPFQVICELIGVPVVDRESFRAWSNVLVAGSVMPAQAVAEAMTSTAGYVRELVERKRSEPDEALLSGLIQASDAGDRLDEDELTSLVFLLLLAGHETTVNLISNGMYLLLDNPEQADLLRQDPSLLPTAIEEFLRYESPVKTTTMRMTTQPVTFGEVTIPEGEIVMISLMSANRDGAAFDNPEKLDLSRQDGNHLAFGHGPHFCLGAPLARLEGQIAIGSLLERFPRMRPAMPLEELTWRPGLLMRGLAHLPVRLG